MKSHTHHQYDVLIVTWIDGTMYMAHRGTASLQCNFWGGVSRVPKKRELQYLLAAFLQEMGRKMACEGFCVSRYSRGSKSNCDSIRGRRLIQNCTSEGLQFIVLHVHCWRLTIASSTWLSNSITITETQSLAARPRQQVIQPSTNY